MTDRAQHARPPRRSTSTSRLGRSRLLALATVTLGVVGLGAAGVRAQPPAFRIVVHQDHAGASVDRAFLARVFLKKTTTWGDGEPIRPVDLPLDSPIRQHFSEDVLQRSVAAVRNYWQQLIFSGRGVPPPELESDEAVLRYVARHPGAVGYVSGSADTRTAKVLTVN